MPGLNPPSTNVEYGFKSRPGHSDAGLMGFASVVASNHSGENAREFVQVRPSCFAQLQGNLRGTKPQANLEIWMRR
jgi:hypothetical protein